MYACKQLSYYDVYIKSYIFNLISFMYRNNFCYNDRELEKQKDIVKILPAIEYIEQQFQNRPQYFRRAYSKSFLHYSLQYSVIP